MTTRTRQQGYSLIELLVYIALFAMISIVLVNSLITVMKTTAAAQRYRALQNNGELVMERITRELRNGTTATISACATTPGTLSITSTDESNTIHTNAFAVAGTAVQLTTEGATANNISTSEVVVTSLNFCSISTGVSTAVKTTLVLTTTGVNPVSATFYSTIVLRAQ